MAEEPVRKLAVLLHADVVGSTGLVRIDETLAHERIQNTFRRFSNIISSYNGIAHEIRGDALVAEFSRASDAVSASLAFQAGNSTLNEQLSDDIRPVLRIGIAMGEVIVADNTITGTGIVLAQRLEQLAKPGGICIQGAAYETVPEHLPFEFSNLGDQEFKGFEKTVRVFEAKLKPNFTLPEPDQRSARTNDILYDKPSIAVLPFECKANPEFGDGLANDLTMFLSKFGNFSVTAPQSSFKYRGKTTSVQQIANEMEVQYILDGHIQWAGNRIRVSTQLSQGKTGLQIWAERYTRESVEIFDVQDEIVEMISSSVAHKIDSVETNRNMFDFDHQLTAFDYYIKGREVFFTRTRISNAESMQLIQKAITLDEHLARAYGFMAFLYVHEYRYGWSDNPNISLDQALNFALKALALDSSDFDSHWRLGITYLYRRQFDKSLSEYEIARDKNPCHAGFLTEMAATLIFVERLDEALSQIKQAMRINPEHPEWFQAQLGWVFYELGKYNEAIGAFEKLNNPPSVFLPVMVATLIRLNRIDDAKNVARDLLNSELDFNLNSFNFWPYKNDNRRAQLRDDLELTGLFS